jgi:hypothetical protein
VDEKIWICKNTPLQIVVNPEGYNTFNMESRPNPNVMRFYGYPVVTKLINGNYLIVVTECERRGANSEWAYFYQFKIEYGADGIPEVNFGSVDQEVSIMPNPVTSYFEFCLRDHGKQISKVDISIYNVMGKMVFCQKNIFAQTADFTNRIDVKDLPSGMYVCEFRNDNRCYHKQFIKE